MVLKNLLPKIVFLIWSMPNSNIKKILQSFLLSFFLSRSRIVYTEQRQKVTKHNMSTAAVRMHFDNCRVKDEI